MNFCSQCQACLEKEILPSGSILFTCSCGITRAGTDDDTLILEEFPEMADMTQKYDVFIENSAHDPAGYIIKEDCPKCHLDFMTLIRVGVNETVMYTCTCGYVSTYMNYISAKK
jgi:hypothetical protein